MNADEIILLNPAVVSYFRSFPCFKDFEFVSDSFVGEKQSTSTFYNLFMQMNNQQIKEHKMDLMASFNYYPSTLDTVTGQFQSTVILVKVLTSLFLTFQEYRYVGVATNIMLNPNPISIVSTFREALNNSFEHWSQGMDKNTLDKLEQLYGTQLNPIAHYCDSFINPSTINKE